MGRRRDSGRTQRVRMVTNRPPCQRHSGTNSNADRPSIGVPHNPAFPHEAGLVPGIRAMEDRDRDLMVREVLADMLVEAERTNDAATLGSLANLSVRSGPDAVELFLLRCAQAREAWEGPLDYAARIGRLRPDLAPVLAQACKLYADARYGAAPPAAAARELKACARALRRQRTPPHR